MKQNDELLTAMNIIAQFAGLRPAEAPSLVKAILLCLKAEGINLEWDEKENKFRRGT